LTLPDPLRTFVPAQMALHGISLLSLHFRHTVGVSGLPLGIHRDPFDRLLVAQAIEERLSIISADPGLDGYGVERLW